LRNAAHLLLLQLVLGTFGCRTASVEHPTVRGVQVAIDWRIGAYHGAATLDSRSRHPLRLGLHTLHLHQGGLYVNGVWSTALDRGATVGDTASLDSSLGQLLVLARSAWAEVEGKIGPARTLRRWHRSLPSDLGFSLKQPASKQTRRWRGWVGEAFRRKERRLLDSLSTRILTARSDLELSALHQHRAVVHVLAESQRVIESTFRSPLNPLWVSRVRYQESSKTRAGNFALALSDLRDAIKLAQSKKRRRALESMISVLRKEPLDYPLWLRIRSVQRVSPHGPILRAGLHAVTLTPPLANPILLLFVDCDRAGRGLLERIARSWPLTPRVMRYAVVSTWYCSKGQEHVWLGERKLLARLGVTSTARRPWVLIGVDGKVARRGQGLRTAALVLRKARAPRACRWREQARVEAALGSDDYRLAARLTMAALKRYPDCPAVRQRALDVGLHTMNYGLVRRQLGWWRRRYGSLAAAAARAAARARETARLRRQMSQPTSRPTRWGGTSRPAYWGGRASPGSRRPRRP
jgi:hypothetical protein